MGQIIRFPKERKPVGLQRVPRTLGSAGPVIHCSNCGGDVHPPVGTIPLRCFACGSRLPDVVQGSLAEAIVGMRDE